MDANIHNTALAVLQEAGLLVSAITFDGVLHRVPTIDKPHGKDAAYIAHTDPPTSLWWQNWRTGESDTWIAKGQNDFIPAEREAFRQRIEAERQTRAKEQEERHKEAAAKAINIYNQAANCTEHLYLTAKGVKAVPKLKVLKNGSLVVPVSNKKGKIVSLQLIDGEGNKRFLTGGRNKGCYFAIGIDTDKPLVIAERLATAASIFEASGLPCLVAFDAGSISHVAAMARAIYPERRPICGDNDIREVNP